MVETRSAPEHDGQTGPYACSCGWRGTMEQVVAHVSHKINVERDTRYHTDGGHAVDMRSAR